MKPRPLVLALQWWVLVGAAPACVVHHATPTEPAVVRPAEPVPPPADFREVQDRLEALIVDEIEVDRRDRIDAALDLLRAARLMTPADQVEVLKFLQRWVAIEERSQPMEAPALFAVDDADAGGIVPLAGPRIEEQDLGGVEVIEPPPGSTAEDSDLASEPGEGGDAEGGPEEGGPEEGGPEEGGTELDDAGGGGAAASDEAAAAATPGGAAIFRDAAAPDPVDLARAALEDGDPAAALAALEPCDRVECGDDFPAVRQQAVDAWVHGERERAGALFMRARGEADPAERVARLEEARAILAELVERFPDAAEAEDIRRNIETVQRELEAER